MPCEFPEHHGRATAGVSAAGVAVVLAAAAVAVAVAHSAGIADVLVVILAVMAVVAVVGLVVLYRLLTGSRGSFIEPSALPRVSSRAAVTRGHPAVPGRQLPAPARIKAIAAPARPVHVLPGEVIGHDAGRPAE
jgi:hypothetical protein